MHLAKLRIQLRWGISGLLAVIGMFFFLGGFSTSVLGQGAERGPLREAWNQQAAFQFAMATLTWLGSVVIFVSLRPGGLVKVFRGQKISQFKRWFYIVGLVACLGAFILADPRVLITKLEIHRCVKVGGNWNYLAKRCEVGKASQ